MINPAQIPDEAVDALGFALGNLRPTWDYRDAIAAALSAWPGAQESGMTMGKYKTHIYILPLPEGDA